MNDRGLLSSLFDLSFTHFVLPKLWKLLYVLMLAVNALWAVGIWVGIIGMGSGFVGKVGGFIIGILVSGVLFLLLTIFSRAFLEVLIVVFRGVEHLREINENIKRHGVSAAP